MERALIIAPLSALLVATHIGMATARPRAWLVSGLGENWLVALYLYATVWREVHQ